MDQHLEYVFKQKHGFKYILSVWQFWHLEYKPYV